MPNELEAKIKVDSLDDVRRRLSELAATRVCRVLESNRIFDTADRTLFRAGCGLRIRTCTGDGDVPRATLTYKGPQAESRLKSREEIETGLDDAESASAILHALSYVPVIAFEKRRERWRFERCIIELDELPRLGCYVEIEGPDEAAVNDVQQRLGLADRPTIARSYIALLIDHARANNLPSDRIAF